MGLVQFGLSGLHLPGSGDPHVLWATLAYYLETGGIALKTVSANTYQYLELGCKRLGANFQDLGLHMGILAKWFAVFVFIFTLGELTVVYKATGI